jgi:hypothetical protein
MPSQTAGRNLPYPLGTDRVMDGDDAIRKLAQSVDNMIQVAQVTVPITAANAPASVTWTYPVPFSAPPPVVLATLNALGPLSRGVMVTITALTATNCVVNAQASSGTANVSVFVVAIGPVTPVT